MDLIYRFHQVHSLLSRLIDHVWSLAGDYQVVLNEKLQIGISRSEVKVCLIYHWSEPLRVDNELSNGNSWRESHEKDQTALRPRIQDISSSRA